MEVASDWYDGWFEGDWLDEIALRIPEQRTALQVDFLADRLDLRDGAHVLDLGCGHGRIALGLARRGYRVTGLDLSPRSLELARDASERDGLGIEWLLADMREIPDGVEFDAVVSLMTAFGYFDDDAENQRVLEGVARGLAPGGAFLVDVINLLGLARNFQSRVWSEGPDGTLQLDEHEYDVLRGRTRARWTFVRADGTRTELVHSVRCYTPHELAAMLERVGLEVTGSWGGWDGSALTMESRRLILLARKPT